MPRKKQRPSIKRKLLTFLTLTGFACTGVIFFSHTLLIDYIHDELHRQQLEAAANRLSKTLTNDKEEITKCKRIKKMTNCFAKRFAAKEAFVKAIGTGFRSDINFIDIEIKNYRNGKPYISLSKKLNNFLQKKFKIQKYKVFLSLSCLLSTSDAADEYRGLEPVGRRITTQKKKR